MAKVDTLARKSRMIHIADATVPVSLSQANKVLAVKVRSSADEYYFYSGMKGKNPTDDPADFPVVGDNLYGPYPIASDPDSIGYHEVSDEIGDIWVACAGAMKVEVFAL